MQGMTIRVPTFGEGSFSRTALTAADRLFSAFSSRSASPGRSCLAAWKQPVSVFTASACLAGLPGSLSAASAAAGSWGWAALKAVANGTGSACRRRADPLKFVAACPKQQQAGTLFALASSAVQAQRHAIALEKRSVYSMTQIRHAT